MTQKSTLIDMKNAASILGVSPATVRNWIKSSLLTATDLQPPQLDRAEVELLKKRIAEKKIKRLTGHANKSKATSHFIPVEYLNDPNSFYSIRSIVKYGLKEEIGTELLLFLIALNWLIKEGIAIQPSSDQLQKGELGISHKKIRAEMQAWMNEIAPFKKEKKYTFLLAIPLPEENDVLGLLYQSLQSEGKKSCNGSYYTPSKIVQDIVRECVKPHHTVLDPCCGTGQFLLEFAGVVNNPEHIYGFDVDPIAVRIARLNLLVRFRAYDFQPRIFCQNMLLSPEAGKMLDGIHGFEVIATNPPWGYHFSGREKQKLQSCYPGIRSMESYSYFLSKCIQLMSQGGILSFILPESILQVAIHKDIRNEIMARTRICKISYLGAAFKHVFTPVIRLDLKKEKPFPKQKVKVFYEDKIYECEPSLWKKEEACRFAIFADDFSFRIIEKVFSGAYTTLKDQADWALGIVTGNNNGYVKKTPGPGLKNIYAGRNVQRYKLSPARSYIDFKPEEFQQVAPLEWYFSPEKLIYRFVSNKLIVAYDDRQQLTLNSANIMIPKVPDYPMKIILALFNSSLYQFLYQKKFSGVKVLRSYLEALPLPLLSEGEKKGNSY